MNQSKLSSNSTKLRKSRKKKSLFFESIFDVQRRRLLFLYFQFSYVSALLFAYLAIPIKSKRGCRHPRMRPTEKYELFDENGMSHIPFNLSHRTNNERYSICGLPSLYLSSSAYGCWMEMNCPRIETVNIALFKPKNNIKFLDLCYPNENELYDKNRMMLLPIIVACDMPVKYPNANYKYEYTIPQLILESLVKYRNNEMSGQILGIRYISVKRKTANLAYSYKSFKRLYYNYVFPPVEIKYEGQCPVIKEKFKFIKATTCFHMQNVDHEIPISKKYNDQYEQGLFYRLECHLENQMLVSYSKGGALT